MKINFRVIPFLPLLIPISLILLAFQSLGAAFLYIGSVLCDIGDIRTPNELKEFMSWLKDGAKK